MRSEPFVALLRADWASEDADPHDGVEIAIPLPGLSPEGAEDMHRNIYTALTDTNLTPMQN